MLSSVLYTSSRLPRSTSSSASSIVLSSLEPGGSARRHVPSSAFKPAPSNTHSVSTKSRSPRRSAPGNWWQEYGPNLLNPKGTCPDVGHVKSPPSASVPDLSFLRPPPQPFVLSPQPDLNGRVSLLRRIRHWWATIRAEYTFYEQALAQHKQNQAEFKMAREALPKVYWRYHEYLALYAGSTFLKSFASLPQLARPDYQLLIRHRGQRPILDVPPGWGQRLPPLGPFLLRSTAWTMAGLTYLMRPIFLRTWCVLVAARLPLGYRMIPKICWRPIDKTRELKALCKRYDYFRLKSNTNMEHMSVNSALTEEQKRVQSNNSAQHAHLRWQYVAQDAFICKIIPRLPYSTPEWISTQLDYFCMDFYRCLVADTFLIMREGGFKRLSADDIYEYCVQTASPTFLRLAKQHLDAGTNPVNEMMKRTMVPVLEERARRILSVDFTRVSPSNVHLLEPWSRIPDYDIDSPWAH